MINIEGTSSALPPLQRMILWLDNVEKAALPPKNVDLQKVLNSSSRSQKAKNILEKIVKEKQAIIDMKGIRIQNLKETAASDEIIQKEINDYRQTVTDVQKYIEIV